MGFDHQVTYYENGKERTKTETVWKPFSGTGTDGGLTTFCAFGDETTIDALTPFFMKDDFEFEAFKETDKYPLKRRADRSCDEAEKRRRISSLEYSCKYGLPGDRNRNFRSNGRCSLSEVKAFYYVPSYSLIAKSNGHPVAFCCVANKKGQILHVFTESNNIANQGDEIMPDRNDAKKLFRRTSFGIISLVCLIVFPLLIVGSIVMAVIFGSYYFFIGLPIYIGGLIAAAILRRKTTDKILGNLIFKFKRKKLEACIECLNKNNMSPLTDSERRQII